jgi:hypothetical protein
VPVSEKSCRGGSQTRPYHIFQRKVRALLPKLNLGMLFILAEVNQASIFKQKMNVLVISPSH